MIDVVVGFDQEQGMYKIYEPTTDTLFVTASLGDSFLKLSEFLKEQGMIPEDILKSNDIRYHIDSSTFVAMVESNVNLMKRLSQGPSSFMISDKRFGQPTGQLQQQLQQKKQTGRYKGKGKKPKFKSGNFSKSAFGDSYRKFGGNGF
jgi:hypothetical protein